MISHLPDELASRETETLLRLFPAPWAYDGTEKMLYSRPVGRQAIFRGLSLEEASRMSKMAKDGRVQDLIGYEPFRQHLELHIAERRSQSIIRKYSQLRFPSQVASH